MKVRTLDEPGPNMWKIELGVIVERLRPSRTIRVQQFAGRPSDGCHREATTSSPLTAPVDKYRSPNYSEQLDAT